MAAIAGHAASSLFAAFPFSGASLLFKHLDGGNDYKEEMKRHNLAQEDLEKAKEKFYENEIEKKDEIAQRRAELVSANKDIDSVNESLDLLQKITYKNRVFTRPPIINDFYKPSPKMKEYEYIWIGIIGLGTGYLIYKIV